jgi:hypothetical protein
VVRVSAAEFSGRAYEQLRQKSGEVEEKRRDLEFNERLRELLKSEKMGEFKSESDLEEYIAQLAQERGVSDSHREHELTRLKQVQRHELEAAEAVHQMDEEDSRVSHDIGIDNLRDAYARAKQVQDAEADIEVGKMGLELRSQKEAGKLKAMSGKADILKGVSMETRISLEEDPQKRAELIKLHTMEVMKGRSTEEILVIAAQESPEAARALTESLRARNSDLDEQKKLSAEHSAQLERILDKSLKAMGEAAKASGGDTTILK